MRLQRQKYLALFLSFNFYSDIPIFLKTQIWRKRLRERERESMKMNMLLKVLGSTSYSSQLLMTYRVAVLVLVVFHIPAVKGLLKLPPNETVPAVIVFGDSIMDTGNNNDLNTLVKCNFPPYGQDFKAKKPTGRFGNGLVPSDIIVQELGIKEFLPAYADSNLNPQDLLTGVCFASGGTGFDPMTPKIVSVLSLSDQLGMFKEYIGRLQGLVGEERTNFILANSLFLVVAGSDDIANTYFTIRARKLQYDVPAYTDLMVNSASEFLQELYGLGARRIGVFSAPPIGCVPSQRTLGGGLLGACAEDYNGAATLFNSKLTATLDSLGPQLPNSKLVYIDVYNPLLDLIMNHQNYGLEYVNKGCCGTGAIEVAVLCNSLSKTCTNSSDYVFWDSYHPTEASYRIIVPQLMRKYLTSFF